MIPYLGLPRDQTFVNFFAKNMGKNFGKNISKSLTGKYGHKRIDHAHQSITDAFKTSSKRAIQKRQKKLMV